MAATERAEGEHQLQADHLRGHNRQAQNAEESGAEEVQQHLAGAGGAARSIIRSALLTVTRTAPIGQLPIRHVAKGIGVVDRINDVWDSARSSFKTSTETGPSGINALPWSTATLRARGSLFVYGLGKNALLGSVLFETQERLVDEQSITVVIRELGTNPLWQPAVAGLAAGALHGALDFGFEKAEAAARKGPRTWFRELAQHPGGLLRGSAFRNGVSEGLGNMSRHAVSHATLFGVYASVFSLVGPHANELRDEDLIRREYGHLLLTTSLAGVLAGVSQEWVNSLVSGVRVSGADE
jgi:hypothetical protein